ncbi:MAG: putative porin, partial [Thermoplasmatota archaeon]
ANQNNPIENIFLRNYFAYISHHSKLHAYRTKKPFTNLGYSYSMGGKDEMEQMLNVFHTQNVNENFNFGIRYDLLSPRGQYLYQKHKVGSFSFFSSFSGRSYINRIAVNFNKLHNQKNGGVVYEDFISEKKDVKTYNTHLDGYLASNKAFANELLRNNQFFIDHLFHFSQ